MKVIKLREDCNIKIFDTSAEVVGYRIFSIPNISTEQAKFLKQLKNGIRESELKGLSDIELRTLKTLIKNEVITKYDKDASRNEKWLSHFTHDAATKLEQLVNKNVLIVGCGGTGAIVADHLARAGVKNFILIDGAQLDAPDLNRQFPYLKGDIGQNKAKLLKQKLKENFDCTSIIFDFFVEDIKFEEKLKDYKIDFIINCADKPKYKIQKLITQLSINLSIPVLFGAVGIDDYLIGPLLNNKQSKKLYIEKLDEEEKVSDDRIVNASICFTNTIASADIAMTTYKYLIKEFNENELNKIFQFQFSSFSKSCILDLNI